MSSDLLAYIESVGNVGGGVRYTRGQMVAYGNGWWAVTVRRMVKAGSGYDPDPKFAYFDTTAPGKSGKAKGREVGGVSPQHNLAEKCLG